MKIYNLDRTISVKDGYDRSILNGLKEGNEFSFKASRYEYYVVQLLVLTSYDCTDAKITVSNLIAEGGKEIEKAVTCFNAKGKDAYGKKFTQKVSIRQNEITPVFIGLN